MLMLAVAAAVTVNVALLAQVTGVGLPLLVGLVTKKQAPSWVKAVALAFLAAVSGVVSSAIDHSGTIVIHQAVQLGITSWVTGIAAYYGLHKPTGLAEKVQDVAPNAGIGPASPPEAEAEPLPEPPPPPRSRGSLQGPRQRAATKAKGTVKKA